jgi:hypothetical protein
MNFETTIVYIFKGNPNATYIKSGKGLWSICSDKTVGYISLTDPDGKRKSILDNEAVSAIKYRYPNKDSIYLKNTNGEWFVSDSKTNGFIKIKDHTGERTKTINAGAIEINQVFEKKTIIPKVEKENNSGINLENLIQMALSDNELSDKEIEVLKRKAILQGFDEDEFEIMLNAKLYELKQSNIN